MQEAGLIGFMFIYKGWSRKTRVRRNNGIGTDTHGALEPTRHAHYCIPGLQIPDLGECTISQSAKRQQSNAGCISLWMKLLKSKWCKHCTTANLMGMSMSVNTPTTIVLLEAVVTVR